MSLTLNPNFSNYLDQKGKELIAKIFQKKKDAQNRSIKIQEFPDYRKDRPVLDLGQISGSYTTSQKDYTGRYNYRIVQYADEEVGYKEEGLIDIYKLCRHLLKEKTLALSVNEEFLFDEIFDWLIGSYRRKMNNASLSNYLLPKIEESVIEYRIYLPILYLETHQSFKLANVNFTYITDDYIEKVASEATPHRQEDVKKFLQGQKGKLFGSYIVKAEQLKAIELAVAQVSFAIDILKIVTPVINDPEMPIYFDIDSRNIHQLKNELIVQPVNAEAKFKMSFSRRALPFEISAEVWDYLIRGGLATFNKFAIESSDSSNELAPLLRNSIANFSRALATHDLHHRIPQIFTILESLLLPSESAHVMESVRKYLPKLISTDPVVRDQVSGMISEMYKIRSAMVHHAKRLEFSMKNLALIQKCTQALIIRLIGEFEKGNTKAAVLKHIDELINRA